MGDDLMKAVPVLARLQHEAYLQRVRQSGEYDGILRSAHREWEALDDETKHSNIDQVLHSLRVKLPEAGLTVAVGPDADDAISELSDDDVVERMAEAEHRRWCWDKRSQGWSYGVPRDDSAKIHPLLVAWEDLDEYERDKDRDTSRELLEHLRQLGFSIVPATR